MIKENNNLLGSKQTCQNSSCSCSENKEATNKNLEAKAEDQKQPETKELDPTHFGDWQVKGRTIDF